MDSIRFNTISEALYSYGASDLNEQILKTISLEELFVLCTSTTHSRTSFRAAWALEHILINNRPLLLQNKNITLCSYATVTNWSVLRSLSKLVIELTKELKKNSNFLDQEEESLLEKTFHILSNIDCPIAVRCNAYDILMALVPKHEWLANELCIQIQFDLERNSTPALSSRGMRILKKLKVRS
ncbi:MULTISPECIES: hypothetical protein [Sphingobacterium]|uniref:hypothetical protein n=1 Tax=Sphingobacterium TaxID=28453 RepID=UPI0013DC03F4|nr:MULTISPECIES: hypothetical protein [unclassified Sphingobacterium]